MLASSQDSCQRKRSDWVTSPLDPVGEAVLTVEGTVRRKDDCGKQAPSKYWRFVTRNRLREPPGRFTNEGSRKAGNIADWLKAGCEWIRFFRWSGINPSMGKREKSMDCSWKSAGLQVLIAGLLDSRSIKSQRQTARKVQSHSITGLGLH